MKTKSTYVTNLLHGWRHYKTTMIFSSKRLFFFLLFLLISNKFYAQSIFAGQHGGLDYYSTAGVTLAELQGSGQYLDIDINGDAIDDFEIDILQNNDSGVLLDYCMIRALNSNSEIAFDYLDSCPVSGGGFSMTHPFGLNSIIDNTLNWAGIQNLYLAYLYDDTTSLYCEGNQYNWLYTSYVAVRLTLNLDTLYGWISIRDGHVHHNHALFTIDDYACNLGTTGIAGPEKPEDIFRIYPNPATDKFVLKIIPEFLANDTKLEIFNTLGEKVHEQLISQLSNVVSFIVPPETYFVRLRTQGEIVTQKLIVR